MTIDWLRDENEALRLRLEEAEETIRAIRSGAVDAFVVEEEEGHQVYTLATADRPYRLLVEQMQQGAATLQADGTIVWCNLRLAELLKQPHEALLGAQLHQFVAPQDLGIYKNLLWQGQSRAGQGEASLVRADAGLVPVYLTFNVLPPDCGALIGVLVTDLTAQRHHEQLSKAHESLRESEEFNRSLMDASPDCVKVLDLDGRLLLMNAPGIRQMEIDDFGDFCGKGWAKLWPGETGQTIRQCLERARAGETSFVEAHCPTAKGTPKWWDISVSPVRATPGGPVIRLLSVSRDITERKKAEEATARLAAVVTSSDDAIITKNLRGVITSWNRGAEHLFGYSAEEAVGRPVTMLIPDDHINEEPEIIARIKRGESIAHYETVRRRKDGSLVDISLTVSPLRDAAGTIIGASKVARDITERKRAEENERAARAEAEAASNVKDEFLTTLSHELRTPLNAIVGWSRLVEKSPTNAELVKEGIQVIARNAKVQADLISDLLDLSAIISGKIRLEIENVELSMIVEAAIDSVRLAAEAKSIRIQSAISSIAEPVRGDSSRLQQVVWNLMANAVKFTPKGGRIQVTVRKANSHAEIVISDTGKGIHPGFLPFVFDRFRQADASSSREQGGLGLGLAIVKQLVELHGGSIRAASGGEGEGSTFTVELPLSIAFEKYAPSPTIRKTAIPCEFDLSGIWVMAVDDERDARELLKRILEECKAEVILASSGQEALELLKVHSPDLLFCDIGMPGMDGYKFIRTVRESGNRTPAVALTAFARSEDRTRSLIAGFQGHVAKPVEPSELIATVNAFGKRNRASN